ncbi:MAG TPA: DUF5110 domain-containing protein [Ignavibacteriales bacterium]|nr:DUF5110 domain-containing protein [Ignavibacteriales bacterium]
MAYKSYRLFLLGTVILQIALSASLFSQEKFEKNDSSVTLLLPKGGLKIVICTDSIIRILHSPEKIIIPQKSLSVIKHRNSVPFDVVSVKNSVIIKTNKLQIKADTRSGSVNFSDSLGNILFSENPNYPDIFTPKVIYGEHTNNAQLNLKFAPNEGLCGLGQFQDGVMNYRGHEETLVQENTQAAQIIDKWNNKGIDTTYRISMTLEAASWHTFKIEFARMADATKLRFAWRTPGMIQKTFDPSHESGTRDVYLPKGVWYDFWTGGKVQGGKTVKREVPIDIIPLYVKAGSIIPMGPFEEYASEKVSGPIALRVYTGANASFDLYDDEGDSYNYEKGAYSVIPIRWNEKLGKLTIGQRTGSFPGMPENLTFKIVWVEQNHGTGLEEAEKPDREVSYNGMQIEVSR